ncbi:isoprenylcysteine carboxylmethyltransferase family protein [Shewanella sp. NIFS-20-20]|uniref:methyltransferase family protein n=1 Tax=Shewanella sp. NIFS-20-20 TaxID=2853806 RepID=UPI002108D236|nr:hypothetical protein [Shewanella sp. NIFS-20-20]
MYVGFVCALIGWGGYLADPLALLLVPVFVWYLTEWQIKAEEHALKQLFGEEYQAYCQQVRRWL